MVLEIFGHKLPLAYKRGIIHSRNFENFTKRSSGHLHLQHNLWYNIMTLAQAVLRFFVHNLPLGYNEKKRKGTQFSDGSNRKAMEQAIFFDNFTKS